MRRTSRAEKICFVLPTCRSKDRGQMVANISKSTSLDGAERDHHRKSGVKEQPVECQNAIALNQDRTCRARKYCKPSGRRPKFEVLTAIAIFHSLFSIFIRKDFE
ncbi:hypothetical protein BDA96_05G099600 [Sorghum bicolor]|uniref:Uncharacterized protein n=2 Tax=Sorghum bicolor TaxID=4558 RepID=A0A1Z5RHW1_SORBI|nr:hypothetical protein BDA96_05G099600 [Sorghum bicolor]OQU83257.1 hypothetical protein SORBI_3005G096932 [Sorghum bicolor]